MRVIQGLARKLNRYRRRTHISLLVTLVIFLFVLPFTPEMVYNILFEIFYFVIFILATISTGKYFKDILAWSVVILLIELISFIFNLHYMLLVSRATSFLFLILITVLTIANIARSRKVDTLLLLEALNAYLLLGIAFSFIVTSIMVASPNAFDLHILMNSKMDFVEISYYTFTTMTTLGYGDLLPVARFAKSTSIFITLTGQIYMTVMIGMLIGKIANERKDK